MNKQLTQSEENAKGELQLSIDSDLVARMTYSRIDDHNIIVDHTDVDPRFKGKGYGKLIVDEMVQWARAQQQKVMPLCPFAKAIIEKTPSYQDILRT